MQMSMDGLAIVDVKQHVKDGCINYANAAPRIVPKCTVLNTRSLAKTDAAPALAKH